jgi:CO/xanthine dehydrogenase Mo-binding subunit
MTGETLVEAHYEQLLSEAATAIGWDYNGWDKPAISGKDRIRAKGIACTIKSTLTPSSSSAVVRMNDDGSIDVLTSSVDMGQGLKTALAVQAAEQLGVDVRNVRVSEPDTASTPFDQSTNSSRATFSMGRAVVNAAVKVRDILLDLASAQLEISAADLTLSSGEVCVNSVPGIRRSYQQVIVQSGLGSLLAEATFKTDGGLDPQTGQGVASADHWHQGVGAVEIDVDLNTGKIVPLRYFAGTYAGRVVSPVQAELQTEGNIALGIGLTLQEELVFEDGHLLTGDLSSYMIPSILDVPEELMMAHLEAENPVAPHGLGESTLPPVMAAVGNALYRGIGIRLHDLPLTAEKVLRAIDDARKAVDEAPTSGTELLLSDPAHVVREL